MCFFWEFRVSPDLNKKPRIHVKYEGKEEVFSLEEVFSRVLGHGEGERSWGDLFGLCS